MTATSCSTALRDIFGRNRAGERVGVYSVCSAHPLVIRAAVELALHCGQLAVIEATCNQVNQFGGYTGLKPFDYAALVRTAAADAGLSPDRLVLGGDHLGPNPWRREPAAIAMAKALVLVEAYVLAGFTKIHLDCSMRCADDVEILPEAVIAERAARLVEIAEIAAARVGADLVYIIGTEVPPPGGMGSGHAIVPTDPNAVAQTFETHRRAFAARSLDAAFERVVGIVVQPGLDFGNLDIVHFDPAPARTLTARLAALGPVVYEAHSTDYQLPAAYTELVDAHFAILKVGPAATFALREAFYALEAIETELVAEGRSNLRATLEAAMIARPDDWAGHYAGPAAAQAMLRHFSFSDRLRYYWSSPAVAASVLRLVDNLQNQQLPLPLISQYLPELYAEVAAARLDAVPLALVVAKVKLALMPYSEACGNN